MSEIDELKAQVAALQKEVQRLSTEIDAIKKTPHFSLVDLKREFPGLLKTHQPRR